MPMKTVMHNPAKRTAKRMTGASGTRKATSSKTKKPTSRTRNGAGTATATASRRNGATMSLTNAKAILQRNGITTIAANGAKRTSGRRKSSAMAKRKSGNRRNGILMRRNASIFSGANLTETAKTIGAGAAGAVVTGIISRSVMSLAGSRLPATVQPFIIKAVVEAAVAAIVIPYVTDKIGLLRNQGAVMTTGGLVKAGLTLVNGLLPDVEKFNLFGTKGLLITNDGMSDSSLQGEFAFGDTNGDGMIDLSTEVIPSNQSAW